MRLATLAFTGCVVGAAPLASGGTHAGTAGSDRFAAGVWAGGLSEPPEALRTPPGLAAGRPALAGVDVPPPGRGDGREEPVPAPVGLVSGPWRLAGRTGRPAAVPVAATSPAPPSPAPVASPSRAPPSRASPSRAPPSRAPDASPPAPADPGPRPFGSERPAGAAAPTDPLLLPAASPLARPAAGPEPISTSPAAPDPDRPAGAHPSGSGDPDTHRRRAIPTTDAITPSTPSRRRNRIVRLITFSTLPPCGGHEQCVPSGSDPGEPCRAPLLVQGDLRFVAEGQADVVEAFQQAVLGELVHREDLLQPGCWRGDGEPGHVDGHLEGGVRDYRLHEPAAELGCHLDGEQASLGAVVAEDVPEPG